MDLGKFGDIAHMEMNIERMSLRAVTSSPPKGMMMTRNKRRISTGSPVLSETMILRPNGKKAKGDKALIEKNIAAEIENDTENAKGESTESETENCSLQGEDTSKETTPE